MTRKTMTLLWAALVLLAGMAGGENPAAITTLTLIDVDGTSVSLSLDALRAIPPATEKENIIVGRKEGLIGVFDYEGPTIADLLSKAPAAQAMPEYKKLNTYVVFKGTDGYQTIASWEELTETADGRRALVVLKKDDKALSEEEGFMRTYFPADKYPCRSVKWLSSIEIHLAPGVTERPKYTEEKTK